MTRALVEPPDSWLRCPRDHSRMVLEIGQHEHTGITELWHACLECEYRERDKEWRPRLRVRSTPEGRERAANRLAEMRLS